MFNLEYFPVCYDDDVDDHDNDDDTDDDDVMMTPLATMIKTIMMTMMTNAMAMMSRPKPCGLLSGHYGIQTGELRDTI